MKCFKLNLIHFITRNRSELVDRLQWRSECSQIQSYWCFGFIHAPASPPSSAHEVKWPVIFSREEGGVPALANEPVLQAAAGIVLSSPVARALSSAFTSGKGGKLFPAQESGDPAVDEVELKELESHLKRQSRKVGKQLPVLISTLGPCKKTHSNFKLSLRGLLSL